MISNDTDMRLGDLIEPVCIRCGEASPEVVGVDINHCFIPTRANLSGVDTSKYLVVPQGCFACNLMHIGRDERIPIAYNNSDGSFVVTPAYYVFQVKEEMSHVIFPQFLYLYFCRKELDRYTWFCTDSSIRGNLTEKRLLDIKIPVPDIETQRHLVEVWKGLDAIKTDNEALASPLMNLCMSYLDKVRKDYPSSSLSLYIQTCDERNPANNYSERSVRGIATNKQFIDTKANLNGVNLMSYKQVKPKQFAFVADTSRRGEKMSLAYNDSQETYIVSSISSVFKVYKSDDLLPEYLYLWFLRPEFDRYARYHSWGSARETFNIEDMARVTIPVPPLSIQQAIVDIHTCARESREIAVKAGELSKQACPALIRRGTYSIAS